jgi:hypothetical protein
MGVQGARARTAWYMGRCLFVCLVSVTGVACAKSGQRSASGLQWDQRGLEERSCGAWTGGARKAGARHSVCLCARTSRPTRQTRNDQCVHDRESECGVGRDASVDRGVVWLTFLHPSGHWSQIKPLHHCSAELRVGFLRREEGVLLRGFLEG